MIDDLARDVLYALRMFRRGRFSAGKLLVVSQVAVSLVLLIGAGLLVRTLRNLTTQDLGFDREHLLLIWTLPGQTGGRGAAAADFWQRAQQRLFWWRRGSSASVRLTRRPLPARFF